MKTKNYTIVLEKGEAPRPFYELTESERQEIGRQIFEKARLAALAVGRQPVTSHTIDLNLNQSVT